MYALDAENTELGRLLRRYQGIPMLAKVDEKTSCGFLFDFTRISDHALRAPGILHVSDSDTCKAGPVE